VHYDFEENKHVTRLNGYRTVFVTAALKEGSNISQVQEQYIPFGKIQDYSPDQYRHGFGF
jgi:hypothetical protein